MVLCDESSVRAVLNLPTRLRFSAEGGSFTSELACDNDLIVIEIDGASIFVFGYILAPWFADSESRRTYFQNTPLDSLSLRGLEGLFSLVVHIHESERLVCYSNKAGGARLYIHVANNKYTFATAPQNPKAINVRALNETICFRWVTGSDSLIDGWALMQPGEQWVICASGSVSKHRQNWVRFEKEKHVGTLDELANQSEEALRKSMQEQIPQNAAVAVLLSGGVDSSVLAAISASVCNNLVAVSHKGTHYPNPELSTAETFAREIGLRHEIVCFDDSTVDSTLIAATSICGQPLRNQSSVLLYQMFEHLSQRFDYVIYGEGADTLFGSSTIARYRTRRRKSIQLNRLTSKLPGANRLVKQLAKRNKLRHLLEFSLRQHQIDCDAICYDLNGRHPPLQLDLGAIQSLQDLDEAAALSSDEAYLCYLAKVNILESAVANRLHETGCMARQFGLKVVAPFLDSQVVAVAEGLSDEHFFGSDYVKPVLRRIGERYYSKDLLYLPKWGFPAPYTYWLDGPLSALWAKAVEYFRLGDSDASSNELKWSLIGLYILAKDWDVEITLPTNTG